MITLKKYYESKNITKNQIVLDIETTGLDSLYDKLVLLGIIKIENSKAYIMQYFAETDEEERKLLQIYLKEIENKIIINYNGNTFDIPFLNKRLMLHGMITVFPESLDIYRTITSKRSFFEFESMKLMDIEKHIGIERVEPSRYKTVSKLTEDIKKRDNPYPIMKHNENDLIATEQLSNVGIYFDNMLSIKTNYGIIILSSAFIDNDIAYFTLISQNSLKDAFFSFGNYEFKIKDKKIEINLQVLYGKFDDKNRGYVSINNFNLKNHSDIKVDPHLFIIRQNRLYNYKNILNLSKKIIEENL